MTATTQDMTEQDITDVASAAYRLTTDGAILRATDWQSALYERLSARRSEAGFLLLAPSGAGKTEAVVIPTLGLQRGGAPRRLFLIGPDGATLDDALYRLVPYLKASVLADGVPRTLCVDVSEDEDAPGNLCRRFFSDGSEDPTVETNPLEADVDLVLTTFTRFRALFFGGGGIHALPSPFAPDDGTALRRNLFFFDDAQPYDPDGFARFHRLVEFLYAEDTDIVVGASTLPAPFIEELSFLDTVSAPDFPPRVALTYREASDPLAAIDEAVRQVNNPARARVRRLRNRRRCRKLCMPASRCPIQAASCCTIPSRPRQPAAASTPTCASGKKTARAACS